MFKSRIIKVLSICAFAGLATAADCTANKINLSQDLYSSPEDLNSWFSHEQFITRACSGYNSVNQTSWTICPDYARSLNFTITKDNSTDSPDYNLCNAAFSDILGQCLTDDLNSGTAYWGGVYNWAGFHYYLSKVGN